jgi:hypothetical protein
MKDENDDGNYSKETRAACSSSNNSNSSSNSSSNGKDAVLQQLREKMSLGEDA